MQAQRLKLIRAELARSEAPYQKWLDSLIATGTDAYDEELEVSALPAFADAQSWFDNDSLAGSFHKACVALGIVVSCDFIKASVVTGSDRETSVQAGVRANHVLRYRMMRAAVLRTSAASKKGRDVRVLSTQRILVAMPGYEYDIPAFEVGGKQSLSVSFDSTGALASISTDMTGGAANAISALGDLSSGIKGAFDAGTDIAAPFTPGGRAKTLQDKLTLANARAALSPAPDPDAKLKDEVAEAELQARLKVAGQLASGEARSAVIVLGSTAQAG